MTLKTEPIGSVPRSKELQETIAAFSANEIDEDVYDTTLNDAVEETVRRFEETGSPVITDGEQTKSSFVTYPLTGVTSLDPSGVVIPFEDGHSRQLPVINSGPFRFGAYAGDFLPRVKKFANVPIKQAVISASAMSLLYPESGVEGYSKEEFLSDLIDESEKDIRSCFEHGASNVQIDFTEARLALKLDPSGGLLRSFVDLNNQVLARFSEEERAKIGVHTCPGGDHDSTHSADVPYRDLIPDLFKMNVGSFYMQMASEENPDEALKLVADNLDENQRVFVGVIDVCDEKVESVETVVERILHAAKFIPVEKLGTTDDCGFSPFSDDIATSRDVAFEKIANRIKATEIASQKL